MNVQQLQRSSDNDGSHLGFGMNAFMLDALLTAANPLLHLSGHSWPPELVMQQAQCPLLALVSSIVVTSIYGRYPMSPVAYKSQNFFQFASGGAAIVKSSLVDY